MDGVEDGIRVTLCAFDVGAKGIFFCPVPHHDPWGKSKSKVKKI